ncbi:MAG: response regulator [Nitrososphaerales archaeon]
MKRILVVDDSKVITDLTKLILEKSGYECVAANSADKCLDLLDKEKFDLVLLDIAMPGISGLDVLASIGKEEKRKGIKAVLFTASSPTERELEDYRAKGAIGIIKKPIARESLIKQVEKYLTL